VKEIELGIEEELGHADKVAWIGGVDSDPALTMMIIVIGMAYTASRGVQSPATDIVSRLNVNHAIVSAGVA
jgi:hypothetical protein